MIEIRNTSQEPLVLKLSTYEATVEVNPGAVVEIHEYEPGMSLEYWPKYQKNLPRKHPSGVRPDPEVREG